MAAVHARFPIPTAEDQEAARSSGRVANAAWCAILREKHRGLAEAYRQGAEREAAAAEAVDGLESAYASRPMTPAAIRGFLKSMGVTPAERRHWQELAALCQGLTDDSADRLIRRLGEESAEAGERYRRKAVRRLLANVTRRAPPP
jgi:hypothetical protein